MSLFWHSNTYAINKDSLKILLSEPDSNRIIFFYKNSTFSLKDTLKLDTTLTTFHRYSTGMNEYDFAIETIKIGGPIKDIYFTSWQKQFSIGEHSLGKYFYQSANMPYYANVKTPYTEVFYTIAGQEENYLSGVLAAQSSKRLYYGINFGVESTLGYFQNQRVRNSHFRGVVDFNTLNKRYGYTAEYINNRMNFEENGGLLNEAYYDSAHIDKQFILVNLNKANNDIRAHNFVFNQHLNIGKAATDSTKHDFIGKVYFNTQYQSTGRMYRDQNWDSAFYNDSYLDTIQSQDSSKITDFTFDIGVSNFYPEKHQYFTFNIGIAYDYKMYFDGKTEYYFNYASPHADVIFDFYKFVLVGGAKYQIKLYNASSIDVGANDLNLFGKMKFPLSSKFKLDVGLKMDFESPDVMSYNYYSNHFIWKNKFNKQKHIEINSLIDFRGYKLEAAMHTLTDFVYYDKDILPTQNSGSFQVITAKFKKAFRFKKLGSHIVLMYQKSSDNTVVRIPEFVGRGNFFFSFALFKKALIIHPGFDLTYVTAYQGYGYNPAVMQFYSQEKTKLEDQLYIDFYLNFRIKRARIFLKYQNLGSYMGQYRYFLAAGYPQQDAVFKFGLSWKFFD